VRIHKDEDKSNRTFWEELEDENMNSSRTSRSVACEALTVLSNTYSDTVMRPLLNLFESGVQSKHWNIRESAVYSLGCSGVNSLLLQQNVDAILTVLYSLLTDSASVVRASTCWTLGRLFNSIIEINQNYLESIVLKILEKMQDNDKYVQKLALLAIIRVIPCLPAEEFGNYHHLFDTMLLVFGLCFQKYSRKNLSLLYQAYGTMVSNLSTDATTEKLYNSALLPLLKKWESLPDNDKELLAMSESLGLFSIHLSSKFISCAYSLFTRSLKWIQNFYDLSDEYDREFLICGLDLLSSMCISQTDFGKMAQASNIGVLLVNVAKVFIVRFSVEKYQRMR